MEKNEKQRIENLEFSGSKLIESLGHKVHDFFDYASLAVLGIKNDLKNGTFRNEKIGKFEDCLEWLKEHADEEHPDGEQRKAVILREDVQDKIQIISTMPNIFDCLSIDITGKGKREKILQNANIGKTRIRLTVSFIGEDGKLGENEKFLVIVCDEIDQTLADYFGTNNMIVLS